MDYKFNAKETKDKLVKWIKDLFENDFKEKNCCVALSGGKDSSLCCLIINKKILIVVFYVQYI